MEVLFGIVPFATVSPSQDSREIADDVVGAAALARVASASDRPEELLERGAAQLGRPLGLAGPHGEPLAASPREGLGADALAIACAAADGTAAKPAGWSVVPIQRLGHLAVGPAADRNGSPAFVDLLRSLLAAQLERSRLHDRERGKGRGTLARRLVREPGLDAAGASRHAATIGLRLADSYRAALLVWAGGADG